MRAQDLPTVPSTVGIERGTNPFLRTAPARTAGLRRQRLGHAPASPAEAFAAIRAWKNVF